MTLRARPILRIPDLQTGATYLANLPHDNPSLAAQQMRELLDTLLSAPPAVNADFFALLERLRKPLAEANEALSQRYLGKPLPLDEVEEYAFHQVVTGWRKMGLAYDRCAQGWEESGGDFENTTHQATLQQRCLHYTGAFIVEHFRARRELPAGIWLDLHAYYAEAEEGEIALIPVNDPFENAEISTHAMAAYAAALLVDQASPYSQNVRDLELIRRWAKQWAPWVILRPLADDLELPPYVIEFQRDAALHPSAHCDDSSEGLRHLDTSLLAPHIQQIRDQLAERVSPEKIGLGNEPAWQMTPVLERLARTWNQQSAARRFRRFPTGGWARVAQGFPAIYHFVSGGQPFDEPRAKSAYSRSEFDALFTFRSVANTDWKPAPRTPDYPTDDWGVTNHSAAGFRLVRSSGSQRVNHGQLLAVCPHDGEQYVLAHTTWLMQAANGGLIAGLAVLPGMAKAIGLRFSAADGGTQLLRAFLLSANPALREDASLIIPVGLYAGSRILEIREGDTRQRVRLKSLLLRGHDFDRVSFEKEM